MPLMEPLRICIEQMSEFETKRKRYQVTALAGTAQLKGNKQKAVAGLRKSATTSHMGMIVARNQRDCVL